MIVVSAVAPKYQPIAEIVPELVSNIGILAGTILGIVGRLKADKKLTT